MTQANGKCPTNAAETGHVGTGTQLSDESSSHRVSGRESVVSLTGPKSGPIVFASDIG